MPETFYPTTFTPAAAIWGGILLGLAVTLMMLLFGRIAGISGITAGALPPWPKPADIPWRYAFVFGMACAPLLYIWWNGSLPERHFEGSLGWFATAGFLIGIGSRLGNGCTSGHGIAGLARLSPRSFVAVAMFLVGGMSTVYLVRHVWGG